MLEGKCEYYLEYNNGFGYCGKKDLRCLEKKYKEIRKYHVKLPYKKLIVIYSCDGVLPK